MRRKEPWSKEHKRAFRECTLSLSTSFAQPLSQSELIQLTLDRGDHALIEQYHNHTLEYTPNGGSLDLREAIADTLYGPQIGPENILIFCGAQVALQTAAQALASDCHSIVFCPGYQSTIEAPMHASSSAATDRVTQIPRRASSQWQIDPQQVKDAIRDDTKYMVLNEPYNPAGILMTADVQKQLIALAEQHDIVVLCDEVYRGMEHDSTIRLPAMCDAYAKGLSVVTLSKAWGGCGITIGWIACRDLAIKQKLVDAQYFGTACPSRASEIQALMVLRASHVILARNVGILRRNVGQLREFLQRYRDLFEWVPPVAGAIAFLKFRGPLSSQEFGAQLAREAGVSIKPAYCFSNAVTPDIDYFRVGFGEEQVFPQALQALTRFVEEHQQAWRAAMKQSGE